MRFGAVVPCLNEWRFVPAVVGQLLKVVDRCLVLRCTRSFSGAPAALSALPVLDPRVEVIQGAWENAHETRNVGLEALADCDYVFTLDSDEFGVLDTNRLGLPSVILSLLMRLSRRVQSEPPRLLARLAEVRVDAWIGTERPQRLLAC